MLEIVFKKYKKEYDSILESFYPSLGSTGFQERNLTINFSKAYEKTYSKNKVISWFELQFGEDNKNHLDAIIIDLSENRIFLIESKRYSNPSSKIESVNRDIKRIMECSNYICSRKERFENFNNFEIYGVILADVWLENNKKKEIYNLYKYKKMFIGKCDTSFEEYYALKTKKYEKYALLSYIWKI